MECAVSGVMGVRCGGGCPPGKGESQGASVPPDGAAPLEDGEENMVNCRAMMYPKIKWAAKSPARAA
jgi:hypothetical protein